MREFIINQNDSEQRLDKFLLKACRALPVSMLCKAVRNKDIKVNGKRTQINYRLQENDVVRVYLNDSFFEEDTRDFTCVTPDIDIIKQTLPIWDKQFSAQAAIIIKARNEFLTEISPIAESKHAILSNGKEKLIMKTESGYYGTEEEIAYAVEQDLKTAFEKDIRLGFTSVGPHRDDIKFMLNDLDVRVYGSQGQQRTVALSLKLAETEMFKNRVKEYPILILDDVLSELDKKRQKKLVELVKDIQTIFTTTSVDRSIFKGVEFNKIIIENGKVKR